MARYPTSERSPLEHKADTETRQQEGRKKRVPLGIPRQKLTAQQRDGYVRRWVVDRPGRLSQAEDGGYTFVTDPLPGASDVTQRDGIGSRISRVVGTHEDRNPMTAYLMEIKKEWYDEDQKLKGKSVDTTEAALKTGSDQHGSPGEDGRYIPKEGIKIEQKGPQ